MLAARLGYDPLSHFSLEHQSQRRPPGRPGIAEPAQQERGADIVGKIGDDMCSIARYRPLIDLQCVSRNNPKLLRILDFQLRQRRQAAPVALDRDYFGARVEQGPRQTAWARP